MSVHIEHLNELHVFQEILYYVYNLAIISRPHTTHVNHATDIDAAPQSPIGQTSASTLTARNSADVHPPADGSPLQR